MPVAERHTYSAGATLPLVAMLGSVGRSRIATTAYDWHGLKRGRAEFALLQYTIAGRGALFAEGREYAVTPGTAMLLTFPADNRYWFPEDSAGWDFFYLCLYGAEVMRIWSASERFGDFSRLKSPIWRRASKASLFSRNYFIQNRIRD